MVSPRHDDPGWPPHRRRARSSPAVAVLWMALGAVGVGAAGLTLPLGALIGAVVGWWIDARTGAFAGAFLPGLLAVAGLGAIVYGAIQLLRAR